ncbi:MAG: SCO family protein [Gammaproteobacteria bacterium]|nr:SCO family protein [Gammaproteobacteria bacterium]
MAGRLARRFAGAALAALAISGATHAAEHNRHSEPVVLAPGYADLAFVPPPAGSYELPSLGPAADGAVLDTQGAQAMLHDYFGDKVVVLSFIFTTCGDVNGCPLATHVFSKVQDRLIELPQLKQRVRLLSLSFDPAYDTPEVMASYAGNFRQPGFDWHFLTTANEAALAPILRDYGQWVIKDYDEDGRYLGTMSHLLRVFLIDERMRIRNIYSVSFLHADTIANDVETLLGESSRR